MNLLLKQPRQLKLHMWSHHFHSLLTGQLTRMTPLLIRIIRQTHHQKILILQIPIIVSVVESEHVEDFPFVGVVDVIFFEE